VYSPGTSGNCGSCGTFCNTGEDCCVDTCTPLGTDANCSGCGDACTRPGEACVNLTCTFACSNVTNGADCTRFNCTWTNNTCVDSQTSCQDYPDESACTADAACTWIGVCTNAGGQVQPQYQRGPKILSILRRWS